MNKTFVITLSILFCFKVLTAQYTTRHWVWLKDKKNSPYSIANPAAFLSERAIERRVRQGIALTENDIPVNPAYLLQLKNCGVKIRFASRWMNAVVIEGADETSLNVINQLPFVRKTEAVAIYKKKNTIPEDETPGVPTIEKKTKNDSNVYDYGSSLHQVEMLSGTCLHNRGYNGKNMLITLLDAGFYRADSLDVFDSLWVNNQILGTRDFVVGGTQVFEDNNHGSSVLSCIAGNIPGQLVGTAPKAKFWLVRTEDAGSELIVEEDNWVRGAEFADSVGADVINSSLGYTTFDIASQNHTWADLNGKTSVASIAATIAARKGIVVCNSAGNEGAGSWHYIGIPADADSIITVGAVDAGKNIAGFSSVGPTADGRIKPTVCAQGVASVIVSPFSNSIVTGSGTSFASPITAGMVATLWQANPAKGNMEIIEAIKQSASQYGNPDNSYGYGIPDFCRADSILKGLMQVRIIENDNLIMISPNPFIHEFSFTFSASVSEPFHFEIYDIQGKLLLSELYEVKKNTHNTYRIAGIESLARGMYVFVAKSDKFATAKKIIKE